MKKRLVLIMAFILLSPLTTNAAVISYELVTKYTDGSAIPAAKLPSIVYIGWYGLTQGGPFTETNRVTNKASVAAPDPAAGTTAWYSVSALLDGRESAKAPPASLTVAPPDPATPAGCSVRLGN